MKTIIFLLLVSIPMSNSTAQSVKHLLDALVKNDNTVLNKYVSVDATLNLDGQARSGKQAVISAISEFIANTGIRSNKLVHEGVTKGKEAYMGIGSLLAEKTKYRVYFTFGSGENKGLVQEIKIEKDVF